MIGWDWSIIIVMSVMISCVSELLIMIYQQVLKKIMKFFVSNIVDGWFCICNSILSIYPCSLSLVYYTTLGFCVAENISETKSLRLRTLTQLRHVTCDNWIAFH